MDSCTHWAASFGKPSLYSDVTFCDRDSPISRHMRPRRRELRSERQSLLSTQPPGSKSQTRLGSPPVRDQATHPSSHAHSPQHSHSTIQLNTSASVSVAARTLAIPELLLSVLQNLGQKDLVITSYVNRDFGRLSQLTLYKSPEVYQRVECRPDFRPRVNSLSDTL